uniref:Reverse transcriptase domain-containing protein n=1 Tax=Varanus komodoensis TaxID=61221 RepID=A0A8D2LM88_VARKO
MLSCDFSTGQVYPRGKPLWRLTTKQLNNISCKEMLASTLANMLTLCDLYEDDLAAWWERCKRIVRKRCWSLDVRINSKEVKTYQEAVYQFVKCHGRVNRGLPYDKRLLRRSREVIAAFQMKQRQKKRNAKLYRTKGALVDKDEWVRARTQAPFESMKGLRLSEDDTVSLRPEEMLDVVERYYTQIYREKPIRGEEIRNFFDSLPQKDLNLIHPGLADEDLRELEKPITQEEVEMAITQGKSGSAPGPDGLGWNFYKLFKTWIGPALTKVFNFLLQQPKLSQSFYQSTLIFFAKQGDLTLVKNWRPIALTNVDYRILAKILNGRLARLAPKIVVPGQTSAVPGRSMLDSLCLFRELFELAREKKWKGKIMQLDQTKAFDCVHHEFLWATLEWKGLPHRFVQYVKLLYKEASVTPQVNGHRGNRIALESGVRQGCPLSPLLYVLVIDTVLCRLLLEEGLSGLGREIPQSVGAVVKFVVHADDVSLLVNDEEEMRRAKLIFEHYGRVSGARINYQKSCVIDLGGKEDHLIVSRVGFSEGIGGDDTERVQRVKLLGLWFTKESGAGKTNWSQWLEKLKEKITLWQRWHLNVYQKAIYVKTYVIPVAANISVVYPPPITVMKEAETLLFKFLWGTATFPLARAVAHRPVKEGGLDFPSVTLKFLAGFLSFNFGAYRKTEVQVMSSGCPVWTLLFARHWDRHDWFRQWWREGFTPRAVTTVTKLTGPDFCWDLYAQIKRYKVQAEWLRDITGPVRCLKRNVYGQLLDINCYRPQREKNLTKVAFLDYLKKQEFPITYFTDRRIPYSLWDIRWRFYHQIYKLKVSMPWVPVERQLCPRAHCEKQMLAGEAPQRETYEHLLKLCPG